MTKTALEAYLSQLIGVAVTVTAMVEGDERPELSIILNTGEKPDEETGVDLSVLPTVSLNTEGEWFIEGKDSEVPEEATDWFDTLSVICRDNPIATDIIHLLRESLHI